MGRIPDSLAGPVAPRAPAASRGSRPSKYVVQYVHAPGHGPEETRERLKRALAELLFGEEPKNEELEVIP